MYKSIVDIVGWVMSGVLTLLTIHFVFFAIVGVFGKKKFKKTDEKLKYGLIIPARNEEKVVGKLIESIKKNKYPQDKLQIFVIAHNCTDKTAEISRALGATVYEYNNPNERTMGYAFRHLFECIQKDYGITSFDGFFLFNADNILSEDYFEKMNDAFVANGKKAVVTSCRNSKNFGSNLISAMYGVYFLQGCVYESRGRTVCGCSTRVQGTGYVVSSQMVKDGWKYVTLTEDWEFTADQIIQGNKIVYCDEAMFFDEQPTNFKIMWRQRLRWSKGHLLVFLQKGRYIFSSIFKRGNKAKFSTFDNFANTMPLLVTSCFAALVKLVMLAFAPLFVEDFGAYWLQQLIGFGWGLLAGYAVTALSVALVYVLERKRIPSNVSVWMKILSTLVYPIFLVLSIPMEIVALFKNIEWKQIPHTDATEAVELSKDAAANKAKARGEDSSSEQLPALAAQDVKGKSKAKSGSKRGGSDVMVAKKCKTTQNAEASDALVEAK